MAYSKRLSGRVFPRHVLGLGIVTSIIPAEAPLCYVGNQSRPLSGAEAILDVLKRDGKDKAFSLASPTPQQLLCHQFLFIVSAFVLWIWW